MHRDEGIGNTWYVIIASRGWGQGFLNRGTQNAACGVMSFIHGCHRSILTFQLCCLDRNPGLWELIALHSILYFAVSIHLAYILILPPVAYLNLLVCVRSGLSTPYSLACPFHSRHCHVLTLTQDPYSSILLSRSFLAPSVDQNLSALHRLPLLFLHANPFQPCALSQLSAGTNLTRPPAVIVANSDWWPTNGPPNPLASVP